MLKKQQLRNWSTIDNKIEQKQKMTKVEVTSCVGITNKQ